LSKSKQESTTKDETENQDKKHGIVRDFADLFEELNRAPKMDELVELGHTKDSIKHHFSSLGKLEEVAREEYPDKFFDVEIAELLESGDLSDKLHKVVKQYKKFVITTAVTGCAVHEGFHASLKSFCKQNKAALLILVASDPAHNKSHNKGGYGTIAQALAYECMVVEDTHLNSNFFISTIKLSAKQINPTTGLSDIGQRSGSFVFASPKQSMTLESTSNEKLPHVMMTTGAVTLPNYVTEMYMSERTAYIADKHHVMGAIYVNIFDDISYGYTQLQMLNEEGSFVHFGKRYHPNGKVTNEAPEVLVCGDWHSGETDPLVRQCTEEMLTMFKPKKVALHDTFNGKSINHHEELNTIAKAQHFMHGVPSLEQEFVGLRDDLDWFSKQASEIVIVKSNHDEFLSKDYLRYAKYARDPQNHYFSLDLAKAMMEGKDPVRFGVEKVGLKTKNIRWLQRDEDFKVAGIQLGAHGDIGPSGTRGNIKNMRKSYGLSVTGHSHCPGIWHGAFAVGTSSFLKLGYNTGPSNWMQTHCLVYADGSRQLVNMIKGQWKI
jgi:hypothetical protein